MNDLQIERLKDACRFIQRNDRNGDIMDFFNDYLVEYGAEGMKPVRDCALRILVEWFDDSITIPAHKVDYQDRVLRKQYARHISYLEGM